MFDNFSLPARRVIFGRCAKAGKRGGEVIDIGEVLARVRANLRRFSPPELEKEAIEVGISDRSQARSRRRGQTYSKHNSISWCILRAVQKR
jgi:hypothetical protein